MQNILGYGVDMGGFFDGDKWQITATASSVEYKKASAKLTLTVKPTVPVSVKVTSPKAGTVKVQWKKNTTCAFYEIQYSLKKNFSNKKTVKVAKTSQFPKPSPSSLKAKPIMSVFVQWIPPA